MHLVPAVATILKIQETALADIGLTTAGTRLEDDLVARVVGAIFGQRALRSYLSLLELRISVILRLVGGVEWLLLCIGFTLICVVPLRLLLLRSGWLRHWMVLHSLLIAARVLLLVRLLLTWQRHIHSLWEILHHSGHHTELLLLHICCILHHLHLLLVVGIHHSHLLWVYRHLLVHLRHEKLLRHEGGRLVLAHRGASLLIGLLVVRSAVVVGHIAYELVCQRIFNIININLLKNRS